MESTNATKTRSRYVDNEEDEEDECRICRNPGDADNPLRYPCACRGSIKFVHKFCLTEWLIHSNVVALECEICKHPFSYSLVYADNAPTRLPFLVLVVGIVTKLLPFFLRLSFVVSIWLLRIISSIVFVVEAVASLREKFFVSIMLGVRIACLVFEGLVSPLIYGWLLDFSTVGMFGKTMSRRVEYLLVSPMASSFVHWIVGFISMWPISVFEIVVREILRPGVLYFLNDPTVDWIHALIDDPLHKLAQESLIDLAEYVSLIFILVFLPVKLAIWMAPSVFPLYISLSDPYTEILAGMLLFQICRPFIMEPFRLLATFMSLLRCWFTGVSWALGLTNFLLPRPDENIVHDNGNVNTGEEYEEQFVVDMFKFVFRIIIFLLVALATLLLVNSALIVVPVFYGRILFMPLRPITHGIKCNDLYAFVMSSYALWATIYGTGYAIEHVKSKRTSVLLNQIWEWCSSGIVFKSSLRLAIWNFIIPVLIGLLFELVVIVPMRVPVDESPVFLLMYQDWALGLILWKIWTRLVMLDIMLPLVGDNLRARFVMVRQDRFSSLWVLREIVFPIIMKLLMALCVPYVLTRGVFPMLGYPLVVNSGVYRFAWIGCHSVSLFCFCAIRCLAWFRELHNSIRDECYLIGWRLHDFGSDVQS